MSADRDLAGLVRSWLRQDDHDDADRVLNEVLAQLDVTPQRRAGWLARRFPIMNSNTVRFGIAGVAVVALILLGARFLPNSNLGGPPATPSPTLAPSPTPAPQEARAGLGAAEPGSYYFSDATQTPLKFTFVLPAGWLVDKDAFIRKHSDEPERTVTFSSWIVSHVYGDTCHWEGTLLQVNESRTAGVDELTNALDGQQGRSTSVTDVTLAGNAGKRIELAAPTADELASCTSGIMRVWPDPGPDETGGWPVLRAGQTDVVYVLDVNGSRVVIETARMAGASAADVAELEQIVASIRFES